MNIYIIYQTILPGDEREIMRGPMTEESAQRIVTILNDNFRRCYYVEFGKEERNKG